MEKIQQWAPRALAALLFVVGGALALDAQASVRHGLAAPDWPTTTGELTVQHGVSVNSRQFYFDYAVGDSTYRSWNAHFMPRPMYRPGREFSSGGVTVHYDPGKPSRAVLVPGVSWWGLLWSLLAPLGLVGAGTWLLVVTESSD